MEEIMVKYRLYCAYIITHGKVSDVDIIGAMQKRIGRVQ